MARCAVSPTRRRLNRRGIPAPPTKHWSPATIAHILSNPVYVGDQVWFRSKKQGRDGRTRTEADAHVVTPNAHPAIVDRETFEKRKQMATTRRFDATPNPEHHVNYLLSRLIRCQSCGGSFVGHRHYYTDRNGGKHTRHAYYCSSYLTKGTAVCRSLPVDRDWVEKYVVDQIRERFDDTRWSQLVAASNARIEARRTRYLNDGKAVAQKVGDIDRRIQNYVRAIGDGLDPAMCSAQISELTAQKAKLEEEAMLLQKEDYYARAVEKNLEQLERLRRIATTDFAQLPFGLQRQFVVKFLQALDVKTDRRNLQAWFQVPFDNLGIQQLADEAEAALERGARNDDGPPEEGGPTEEFDAASPEGFADGRYGTKWLPLLDAVRTWATERPAFLRGEAGAALGLVDAVPALAQAMKGSRTLAKLEEGAGPSRRRRRSR